MEIRKTQSVGFGQIVNKQGIQGVVPERIIQILDEIPLPAYISVQKNRFFVKFEGDSQKNCNFPLGASNHRVTTILNRIFCRKPKA